MKDFFRVSSQDGAELCEIRQDTQGQYLADCIQKCAPGVLLKIEKVHKARLGKALKKESLIIKIVSPPGKALGLDSSRGEIHKIAFLKPANPQSSTENIEVIISSSDALKIISGDFSSVINLIALENDTYIDKELALLEFNGLSFPITNVAQLALADDLLLQKGESIHILVSSGF